MLRGRFIQVAADLECCGGASFKSPQILNVAGADLGPVRPIMRAIPRIEPSMSVRSSDAIGVRLKRLAGSA